MFIIRNLCCGQMLFAVLYLIAVAMTNAMADEQKSCDNWSPPKHLPARANVEKYDQASNANQTGLKRSGVVSVPVRSRVMPVTYDLFSASVKPKKGVVVYLCGGPGMSCSADGRPDQFPPDYDVITFDYLGLGKNRGSPHSDDEMSIEAQGEAAAGIIQSLKLTNYVIYGSSFGTTVATIAGETIGKSASEKPKAVVLEGTVGSAAVIGAEDDSIFHTVATRAWQRLNSTEQRAFSSAYDRFAGSMTQERKRELDLTLSMMTEVGEDGYARFLKRFSDYDRKHLDELVDGINGDMNTLQKNYKMYRAAECQMQIGDFKKETKENLFGDRVPLAIYPDGLLDICRCPPVPRPYDPAHHQIKGTALVYIQGRSDTLAPYNEMQYHGSHQGAEQKILLESPRGGHGESEMGELSNCTSDLYEMIFSQDFKALRAQSNNLVAGHCQNPNKDTSSPVK